MNWHNTNEQFTVEEFIRANCEYPGRWDGEVERVEVQGGLVITATRVWAAGGGPSYHVVSFIRTEGERIVSVDEYWETMALLLSGGPRNRSGRAIPRTGRGMGRFKTYIPRSVSSFQTFSPTGSHGSQIRRSSTG